MFSKILGLILFSVSVAAQIQEGRYNIFNAQHPTWSLQSIQGTSECFIRSTNGVPPPEALWTVKRSPRSPPNLYGLGNVATTTFATFDQTQDPIGQTVFTEPSTFGTAFRIGPVDNDNTTFQISVVGQQAAWSFGPPYRGRAKVVLQSPEPTAQRWIFDYLGPL